VKPRWPKLLLVAVVLWALDIHAAPVEVRLPEGSTRGFLTIRGADGRRLGHGELVQTVRGDQLDNRLVLRFDDGSIQDETTIYSQRGVFKLDAYRFTQRGPSFPGAEISFDRASGRYEAKVHAKRGAPEELASGTFDMPADLYNGMTLTLLKNLPSARPVTTQLAVFTPKLRLLRMTLQQEGEDQLMFGGEAKVAIRYLITLDIGGLTGVVAWLLDKTPPDLRYWLVPGPVQAFARFQGPMFLKGPVWRVEITGVD
jgi:hypothetical protein